MEQIENQGDIKAQFDNLTPGTLFEFWVNQGFRTAVVLACLDGETLIEYEMPNGSTGLRILGPYKNKTVSHRKVSTKWLKEMILTGENWGGVPQGNRAPIPSVHTLYVERRDGKQQFRDTRKV